MKTDVSRKAALPPCPRPITQVPMSGRQLTVHAVSPMDSPSSQTVSALICCGSSRAELDEIGSSIFGPRPRLTRMLHQLEGAVGQFVLDALLVVLTRGAKQRHRTEFDLDDLVVRAEFDAAPAQGAVLVEGPGAMLLRDFVDIHRAGLGAEAALVAAVVLDLRQPHRGEALEGRVERSEEHTSELQSPKDIVCGLLLE